MDGFKRQAPKYEEEITGEVFMEILNNRANDEKDIYHIGASLKDLGKKWFAFSKLECESFGLMKNIKEAMKQT